MNECMSNGACEYQNYHSEGQWRRAYEEHPPRSMALLLVSNLPNENWYKVGTYDIGNNAYYTGSNYSVNPTHWMPLPDFPL